MTRAPLPREPGQETRDGRKASKKVPLIILSGPSGSGKSTLIRRLLQESGLPLRLSVSATTRNARPGEENGVNYYFWTREKFLKELAQGKFIEHAEVHGQLYGTLRSEVDDYRERGVGVILDIDVQGAARVRSLYPDHLSIFVRLSAWEQYEERLRSRSTETAASLARRLATAQEELRRIGEYQHVVINDDLDVAVAELRDLVARQFEGEQGEHHA